MNVAVDSAEALLEPGTGQRKDSGELVHSAPKAFSGTSVTFDFSLVAPSAEGTVTLYAAGNSVNADGRTSGDHSASTTLTIEVGNNGGNDPGEDDDGGCAAAGGPPMGLLMVWLIARVRRQWRPGTHG